VHTFASDPTRGVFILAILTFFIGGALTLFAARAGRLAPGGIFAPISREGALVLNNLFLTAATATVFVGTLYPLALEAVTGAKISVGAPFFNLTFVPLMVPLLLIVPFGPLLAWKRGDLRAATERLYAAFGAALVIAAATAFIAGERGILALFGIGLGVWLIAGAISEVAFRIRLGKVGIGESFRRLVGLPLSSIGMSFAHAGVGLSVLGLVAASHWASEDIRTMKPGDSLEIAGRTVTLERLVDQRGPNYDETVVRFVVSSAGARVAVLEPSKRAFAARQTATTEAAIATFGFSQLYISLGDIGPDDATTVRVYWKPLVTLIWLGAVVMALGGLLSLADRRLRVGAPKPARRTAVAAAE
jgi:cytochrome c-type biogenesis protein CcmF